MRVEQRMAVSRSTRPCLGNLLNLRAGDVQELMRRNEITSLCERGEGEGTGRYRLTFFHKGRRARLDVHEAGWILRRSIIELRERPVSAG